MDTLAATAGQPDIEHPEYETAFAKLDAGQEHNVQRLIADKTPDQLKMVYALWTRQAVAQLIEQRFGIQLPVRTMGLYLSR